MDEKTKAYLSFTREYLERKRTEAEIIQKITYELSKEGFETAEIQDAAKLIIDTTIFENEGR
jgi:hypothetical protein